MNPLKKILSQNDKSQSADSSAQAAAPAPTVSSPEAPKPEVIRVVDATGRAVEIPKETWRKDVLPGRLKQAWDKPEELYLAVAQALTEGLATDVIEAAKHLKETDTIAGRGVVMYAIALMETQKVEEAEKLLESHIGKHADDGIALFHLARCQGLRGDTEKSNETLWKSIEINPNYDNSLGLLVSVLRDKQGVEAAVEALKKIAEKPGSWRARLWLAREAFDKKDAQGALEQIAHVLALQDPLPEEALVQISGDLGTVGMLKELVAILVQRYHPQVHGLAVGNNLIKAFCDLGLFTDALHIIESLLKLQQTEWRDHLLGWKQFIEQRLQTFGRPPADGNVQFVFMPIAGPVWSRDPVLFNQVLDVKTEKSPVVCVFAPSVKSIRPTLPVGVRPTPEEAQKFQARDNFEGNFSRALGLYLAEQVHATTTAVGVNVVARAKGHAGFLVNAQPFGNEEVIKILGENSKDFRLIALPHIDAGEKEWKLSVRVLKPENAELLRTIEAIIPLETPGEAITLLVKELVELVAQQEGVQSVQAPAWYQAPAADRWPHQLMGRAHSLVLLLAAGDQPGERVLFGEIPVFDHLLALTVDQKTDVTTRLLLLTTLARHRDTGSPLFLQYGARVLQVQKELPLTGEGAELVAKLVASLYPIPAQPEGEAPAAGEPAKA